LDEKESKDLLSSEISNFLSGEILLFDPFFCELLFLEIFSFISLSTFSLYFSSSFSMNKTNKGRSNNLK
jgi:hypothetical protein